MTSPSYAYSPVFGLGLSVLSEKFMFEITNADERERVKAALCTALQLDPKEVKADADRLAAATGDEAEILKLDALAELKGKPVKYTYAFGAGLIALMLQCGVKPEGEDGAIKRWSEELDLNCVGVLGRDYDYYLQAVTKMEGMQEMLKQMTLSAERQKKVREDAEEEEKKEEPVAAA